MKAGSLVGRLAIAWLTVALFFLFGNRWLPDLSSTVRAALLFLWLFAVILWCAFGVVREADLALILPNFTQAVPAGSLTLAQAACFSFFTVLLYGIFLGIQTGRHRRFFIEPAPSGEGRLEPWEPLKGVARGPLR